jgi:serine protease Do
VRPFLGVSTETVESVAYARWYGLGVNSGVRITGVGTDSPADKAGLKVNDVIVKFDGQDITDNQQLVDAIHKAKVGQAVSITYWRDSQEQSIEITLTESTNPQGQ